MTTPYLAEPPGRPRPRSAGAPGDGSAAGAPDPVAQAVPPVPPALPPGESGRPAEAAALARVQAPSTAPTGAATGGHQNGAVPPGGGHPGGGQQGAGYHGDGRAAQTMNGSADPIGVIFDALLGRAPVAFALHDTAGRYVRVNDVLARLNGRAVAEHVGHTMPELLGDIGHEMEALLARVVATGEPVIDLKVSVATGGPEPPQTWKASWYPATDTRGTLFGVVFVATDATRHADVEVELARLQGRYRTLVEAAAVDVMHAGPDGGLDSDVPRWRMTTGQRRTEVAGLGWLDAVHPDDRDVVRGLWREAVEAGESFDAEFRVVAADGSDRVMHARSVALRDAGGREWVGVVRDVTDLRTVDAMRAALTSRSQAATERGDQLHQAAAALAGAVTIDDVVSVVLDAGARGMGADGRGVALVDPETDRLRFRALVGYSPDYVGSWSEISLGAVHPAAETVRGGRALFLSGREELSSRWPVGDLLASLDASEEQAWAMLPLATTDAPFGVLTIGFRAPRQFSPEDRAFLGGLADHGAAALERAILFERVLGEAAASRRSADAARDAELAATVAQHRLDALGRITTEVAGVVDPKGALRRLANAVVVHVADACEIYLVSADPEAQLAPGADDPRREAAAVRPGLAQQPPPGEGAGPVPVDSLPGRASRGTAGVCSVEQAWWLTPEQQRWLKQADAHTLAAVPVRRGGAVAAVVVFTAVGDRPPFVDADLGFLSEVAARAAVVVAPAEAERDSRRGALALQRALLPHQVAAPAGIDVAAHYVPSGGVPSGGVPSGGVPSGGSAAGGAASGDAEAGGDWYDVIDLGAGRVALVVGDVSGRGTAAAATMGQVRAAARVCARLDLPPAEVLAHLDELVASTDEWQLATCLYAVLQSHTGLLTLASAGHPSPLVVAPDGLVSRLYMAVGAPLGAGAEAAKEYVVRLNRGATLALFTDGLVARRGRDLDVGVSDLAAVLSFATGALAKQAAETVSALGRDGSLVDDAVLLLASLPSDADGAGAAEVEIALVDGVAGLAPARAQARASLETWGLGPDAVDTTVTVLSELAANALQHGRPPLSARIRLSYGQVVVEVGDASGRLPRQRHADTDDETGRGLELVSLVATRWGSRPVGEGKVVWAEIAVPGR